MQTPAISVHDLYKSYRGNPVLQGVSFEVAVGCTYAFLGRNAAGKTTTISALLGLVTPDEGRIRILGCNPQLEPLAVRRRVGYLAEDQQMFGWMTVDEVIRFVSAFYETWDRELADRYRRQFELPSSTKIRHLSKGQGVRLGLLLALAHRPQVVILDDPVLGLDPIMRKEFNRDLIAHLQGEGRTVLYSSHLLYEVEPIADVVGILHEGRIVREGATEELRAQIKRLLLPAGTLGRVKLPHVLDVLPAGNEVAVTVDHAAEALAVLRAEGIEPEIVNLNLDEIFEAFVIGRVEEVGGSVVDRVSAL